MSYKLYSFLCPRAIYELTLPYEFSFSYLFSFILLIFNEVGFLEGPIFMDKFLPYFRYCLLNFYFLHLRRFMGSVP